MLKNNTLIYLFLIISLGFLLRFYQLANYPVSLNWDEVSHAYTAYSLLHTGRDQWGQFLPIFNFRAYGDYPAAINPVFTVASVAIFGPNDFAARFPHALIGTLTIFTTFAAAYYWKKNKYLALLAALFVCLDPWTLFPSRAVFQSNWAVFFLSLGLAFYFKKESFKALVFWGISLFAYHNTRIFIPLLTVPLFIYYRHHKKILIILVSLYLPILLSLLLPSARARNTWVGIIDSGAIAQIENQRNSSNLPDMVDKLLYNRPIYFLTHVAQNYIGYFSPKFLFIQGGTQYQFSLPGFGVLPWVSLPFFYFGLILLIIKRQKFLLLWLLLAPLPAAITRDSYAVIRATTMLPVVQLVTASGLYFLVRRYKYLLIPFVVLLYVFLEQYLINYVTVYPIKYSQSWQYGYKQVFEYLNNYAGVYETYFTKKYGEPHEYLLWYQKLITPKISWDYHANWYWVNSLDNYHFVNDWEMSETISKLPTGHYLLIDSTDNLPGEKLTQINFLDGSPAFIIKRYEK